MRNCAAYFVNTYTVCMGHIHKHTYTRTYFMHCRVHRPRILFLFRMHAYFVCMLIFFFHLFLFIFKFTPKSRFRSHWKFSLFNGAMMLIFFLLSFFSSIWISFSLAFQLPFFRLFGMRFIRYFPNFQPATRYHSPMEMMKIRLDVKLARRIF